jgi:hypothetical protein
MAVVVAAAGSSYSRVRCAKDVWRFIVGNVSIFVYVNKVHKGDYSPL